MDLPPEILLPEVGPNETLELVFQASIETLTVVAQDPEGQNLAFIWQIPHGVVATPSTFAEEEGLTSSVLQLPADPVLDNSVLSLAIFDPGGNDADVSWLLVIP